MRNVAKKKQTEKGTNGQAGVAESMRRQWIREIGYELPRLGIDQVEVIRDLCETLKLCGESTWQGIKRFLDVLQRCVMPIEGVGLDGERYDELADAFATVVEINSQAEKDMLKELCLLFSMFPLRHRKVVLEYFREEAAKQEDGNG